MLERVGVEGVSFATDKAIGLRSYQRNGPDPEGLRGGPVEEEDAKGDIDLSLKKFKECVEEHFESYLDNELKEIMERIS